MNNKWEVYMDSLMEESKFIVSQIECVKDKIEFSTMEHQRDFYLRELNQLYGELFDTQKDILILYEELRK